MWKYFDNSSPNQIAKWKRVLITRSVAIVPAVFVALTAQQNLDLMDQWLNVLQSVQLPFAVLPVLYLTSNILLVTSLFILLSDLFLKMTVMGTFANGYASRYILCAIGIMLISVNMYLFRISANYLKMRIDVQRYFVVGFVIQNFTSIVAYVLASIVGVFYAVFVVSLN
jgi:Mn2+/Fe2+ NRAMP family transporter